MNAIQLCGAVGVLCLIVIVGIWSGRNVKNAAEFVSGGGKSGYGVVAGMVMGTLVGGACTIGTAQLAYSNGISAWWYTLGSGIGCLVVGVFFSKPYRNVKEDTITGILMHEFGAKINIITSLMLTCIYILILATQLLSASTIVPYIFSRLGNTACLILSAVLMLVYVIFGGALGAGEIGKIKIVLLYAAIITGVVVVFRHGGIQMFPNALDPDRYFDLMLFGVGEEAGKALAVIMGMISGQAYMQALRMARSNRVACGGEIISAVMVPLIGIGGVLIGMFMRVNHPALENPKDAFTQFIMQYMPDWLSGIFMGTLLLVVVGAGASVILSTSSFFVKGFLCPLFPKYDDDKIALDLMRVCMIFVLIGGCIFGSGVLGDVVLNLSFLCSRLVAGTLFVPLMCALFLPGKIHSRWAGISSVAGPVIVVIFTVWDILPIDTMFIGVLGSAICCMIGAVVQKKNAVKTV